MEVQWKTEERVVGCLAGRTERVAYRCLALLVGLAGSTVVLEVMTGKVGNEVGHAVVVDGTEAFGTAAVDGWVHFVVLVECIVVIDEMVLSMTVLVGEKGWRASGAARVIEGYKEQEVGFVEGAVVVGVVGH